MRSGPQRSQASLRSSTEGFQISTDRERRLSNRSGHRADLRQAAETGERRDERERDVSEPGVNL